MTIIEPQQEHFRKQLLERLAKLSAPDDTYGTVAHGTGSGIKVFGYCVQERERVAQSRLEHPAVVVVLSGTKEVWRGEVVQRFPSGVPFIVPAGTDLDLVNVPDPQNGRYESICITVDEALRQILRASTHHSSQGLSMPDSLRISLTAELVEAFGHAASALIDPSIALATAVARNRIVEILLLLSGTPSGRMLAATNLAEQVEGVVYSDPAHAWQVEEVANLTGMGASTLRRRLKTEGTSFRKVLLSARMATAANLLQSSGYSVTQASQASGYASRSHFARRVRGAHGKMPKDMRGTF